jgi:outer membrane protein TolC
MVEVNVEIPLQLGQRGAAVSEAEAEHAAELARAASLVDEIRTEVESARQRLIEARHEVTLYRERLLPIARQQIEAARIAYATGRGGFQGLIDAERSVRSLELGYEQATATFQQRAAELERTVGRTPGVTEEVSR